MSAKGYLCWLMVAIAPVLIVYLMAKALGPKDDDR